MKKILLLIPLIIGCSSPKEKSEYEQLLEYNGNYEYIGNTSLDILASELDTILYAVIDNAKYPLHHIALDSFTNTQDIPVVFQRDGSNQIIAYRTGGEEFKLITSEVENIEMFPRKELFHTPENYLYEQPIKTDDGLETGRLEDEFDNPELILDMVKETIKGEFPDVHSILIYKNNKLVLEEYFYGYDENTPHQLRSATKPFIGGLLGIAVDKGFVKSEKDKLLPYFSSKYPEIDNLDNRKNDLTLENFLMYRHGLDCENSKAESKGNEQSMMQSEDWVKYTLDLPMVSAPGKSSSYCTGCALTLGSLVEVSTAMDIEIFAKENLFDPMGILNYDWTFEPNKSSLTTFSSMKIRPRDLVKLAKMYADGGKWKGQQIISEDWVNKTFTMDEGDYGYLWREKHFDVSGKRYSSYQASGNGGQKINIWPELDMITVFTGGNYNSYQLYGISTPPNRMIPNYILKAGE